jgi:hypothetical protein
MGKRPGEDGPAIYVKASRDPAPSTPKHGARILEAHGFARKSQKTPVGSNAQFT